MCPWRESIDLFDNQCRRIIAALPGSVNIETALGKVILSKIAAGPYSRNAKAIAGGATTKLLAVYTPGDLDGDRAIGCSDVAVIRRSFGKRQGQSGFDSRADVTLDGVVDVRDLAYVTQRLPVGTRCQ